ncbi:expressed unknown protein [Seminavis robusta]|uniref:Uncharacterized protein n=1 Tax=Seminavis robusta TaxID=568900 RepID=A0A9N8EAV9_9STRA|nr:expressed unknown protein [Seminavis robusta]|eukprot:Sro743_g196090.1 n/a (634) ;mRNA; r:28705-30606
MDVVDSDSDSDSEVETREQKPALNPEERRGHDMLRDLFWDIALEPFDQGTIDTIMGILRKHPTLNFQTFKNSPYSRGASVPINPRTTSRDGVSLQPFSYLIIGGASIDILKEIVDNMGWKNWGLREQMADGHRYFPLETAIRHRSDDPAVIRFMAEQTKKHCELTIMDLRANPLVAAMDKYAPLETMQVLVDIHPEFVMQRFALNSEMTALERALWNQSPAAQDIIDFLVSSIIRKSPLSFERLKFNNPRHTMTLQSTKALLTLMPYFETMDIDVGNWQTDAWLHFLQNAPQSGSTKVLGLSLPSGLSEDDLGPACNALSSFLTNTSLVEQIRVLGGPEQTDVNEHPPQFIHAIETGVNETCKLQSLELQRFLFTAHEEVTALLNMLVGKSNLKTITLVNVEIQQQQQQDQQQQLPTESVSPIQSLSLSCCRMPPPLLKCLLHVASKMPVLSSLSIVGQTTASWEGLGETMATILDRNVLTRLYVLKSLDTHIVDLTAVGKTLRANTSLTSLRFHGKSTGVNSLAQALEQDNVTLTCCDHQGDEVSNDWKKAEYYANLNRLGRGQVREGSTTLTDLTDLLLAARKARNTGTTSFTFTKLDVFFGMLRERPELWCYCGGGGVASSSSQGRKRKR